MTKPIALAAHVSSAPDVTAVGRRRVLGIFGKTGALLVVGCGGDGDGTGGSTGTGGESSSGTPTTGDATPTTGGGTTTGATGSSGATGDTSSGTSVGESSGGSTGEASTGGDTTGAVDCPEASAWATGGTASMTAQHCYPDPFAGGVPACGLICETTAGPCTTMMPPERKDVSEGFVGLPVRLALLLVDADTCAPVADARIEIWHTERTGVYSGVTPNPQQCYGKDPGAAAFDCFRGVQITGEDGRVDFDTCFPGWYSGRAIHIHFRVTRDGQVYATSQLFFTDALSLEIFASHPEYSEFGPPNVDNSSDNILGGAADKSPYLLDTARMPDGAMLASKVIAIRSSLQDPTCQV